MEPNTQLPSLACRYVNIAGNTFVATELDAGL